MRREAFLEPITPESVNPLLAQWVGREAYVHLETTAGAYTAGGYGAFARSLRVRIRQGQVRGTGPYRAALEVEEGRLYAEGLTHWQVDAAGRLILSGHDEEGRLTVCLELSPGPLGVKGSFLILPSGRQEPLPVTVEPPSRERAVLVSMAHPDDETFGCGGTIARYAYGGVPVTCLTATLGEMGRNLGTPPLANRESLRDLRRTELRRALDALGVGDLRLLGVWDKNTEFVAFDWLVEAVREVIRTVRPSLVISFHPEWGGHPDHRAMAAATVRAAEGLPPSERPRVLCHIGYAAMDQVGSLPRVVVDVSAVAERKLEAARAHASQSGGILRALAEEPQAERWQRWLREETYVECVAGGAP